MNAYWLLILFFFIALFYSSIGFGGGSSYLALLSLVLVDFYEIRSIALTLNVLVVSIGTYAFIRKGLFDWKAFWPYIVFSVPMVFIGTQMRLSETAFFVLLGASLMLAALGMGLQLIKRKLPERSLSVYKRGGVGGAIGFLSGLVGIGGGIFLSPSLNLIGWKNAKSVASLASFFILINSVVGIGGLISSNTFVFSIQSNLGVLLAVFLGGLIGSRLSVKMNLNIIRIMTAVLVMYVGFRLMLLHGFEIKI